MVYNVIIAMDYAVILFSLFVSAYSMLQNACLHTETIPCGYLQVLASCLKNCSHRNAITSSLQSGMKKKKH